MPLYQRVLRAYLHYVRVADARSNDVDEEFTFARLADMYIFKGPFAELVRYNGFCCD